MKYDRGHMENRLFLDGGAGTWIDIESALGSDWSNMTNADERQKAKRARSAAGIPRKIPIFAPQVRSVAAGRRPGEESPGNAEHHAS